MSHLDDILNPDAARKQPVILAIDTETLEEQASSSLDEDDISPPSDDEIDELDEESEGEEDYDDPSPPPGSGTFDHSDERSAQESKGTDRSTARNLENRSQKPPAPRRRLERHDRKIDLGLHDHKAHADCPDTLSCLPDTHGRPQHTLPVILRCAILGSPRKRLTIREIYATMESKYPYYKTAGQTWKQSVRHHLSLNRLFERQPRPVTDPGFGSYWTVNLSAPPGTKRPRKRGRPNKDSVGPGSKKVSTKTQQATTDPLHKTSDQVPTPTKFQFQPQTHPPPPLPPLPQPLVNSLSPRSSSQHTSHQHMSHSYGQSRPSNQFPSKTQSQSQHPIRPPFQHHHSSRSQHSASHHRPHQTSEPYSHSHRQADIQRSFDHRKPSTPMTPASGRDSDYPPSSRGSEPDDTGIIAGGNAPFATVSEDEYESEEDMVRPYDRRGSLPSAFVPTRPSPIFSLPPFSALDQNKEDVIEHMRQEIATLRRTSAEAVSTSIRLSEQLANANLEVSRSREAVRDLEDMLQSEAAKRKDAERQKELEFERRRSAELALNNMAMRSPTRSRPT